MSGIPLRYPTAGLNDSYSNEAQPPLTTRDAENERSIDPTTNRMRGAQRAGSSLFCSQRIGVGAKVQALSSVTYDARATTYSHKTTSTAGDMTVWDEALSNGQDCKGLVHDSQGNLFALDGPASISKYNATGTKVWTFSFPVQDENHVVRALAVDQLTDWVFVGVSEGGGQSNAWIRAYQPDADKKLTKVWEVNPGAYTEQIVLKDDKLYAALNDTAGARSAYAVYENIATAVPTLAFRKGDVPSPVNDLDVKENGEVLTASGPRTGTGTDNRFYDPRTPDNTAILDEQRWDPTKLAHWDERKWAWFSAEDIKGIEDGKNVEEWRDTRGRGVCRLVRDGAKATYKVGRYKAHGLGYKPTVQLDGNNYRYITDASVGNTASLNDVQPTLFPGKGRGYLIVMVVQPVEDTTKLGRLYAQLNSNGSALREMYINTGANGAGTLAGGVAITNARKSTGTDPQTVTGKFNNKCSAAVISLLCDNEQCGAGFVRSVFRVNGVPIARWDSNEFYTAAGNFSYVGCKDDGTYGPIVGISEIFVLQSYDDPDDGLHKVCAFPDVDATADVGTFDATTTDTELERIEGYFAWKYGISHLLDDGAVASGASPSWDAEGGHSQYEHPFTSSATAAGDSTLSPPNPDGRGADAWDLARLSNVGVTTKWSAQRGNIRWAYQGAGMGYAVKATSGSTVYTVGKRTNNATSGSNASGVRALTDAGDSASFAWNYLFTDGSGLAVDYTYEHPRLAVDTSDNLWLPFNASTAGTLYSLLGFTTSSGTPFLTYKLEGGTAPACYAVSVDPRLPDYSTNPTTITRPEFLAIGSENGGDATRATVHKVRAVDAVNNNASPRQIKYLAVAGGSVKTFTASAVEVVGSGVLDADSRWVAACEAFNKVFFADGETYQYYDPKENTVSEWAATDGGAMLPRYRLLCLWRGRMVLARGPDAPFNWQMSEYGNPFGWDLFPPDGPLSTQAVNGQEHEVGEVPDIINTLIPFDRERLVFGCDHTIYALWGDPMENGAIVLLSDITGMAFGAPWARDSDGALYFFGSRGGIFRMSPDFSLKKISGETIDRRLRDVDLASVHMRLVWDDDLQELRIFQTTQGVGGTIVPHWAWCKRTNSWHQDRFSVDEVQPSCVAVFDGDSEDDRVVVYGTEDGYVHKVDRAAKTDRGYRIHSYVTWWPMVADFDHARLRNPKVTLASELDGARLELFASNTPDDLGSAKASVDLLPGQNARALVGVKGAYVGLKLSNAAAGNAWAYETGTVELYPAGRKVATP